MSAAGDVAMLARVSASLVVVVVLAVLAARLARRTSVRGPGVGMHVVDRAALSREASVAVVEIGGRALVVGVTAHTVTVLTELEQSPAMANGPAPAMANGPARHPPTGSVLSAATWRLGIEALRDYTARRA